jgi:hypothetical protein
MAQRLGSPARSATRRAWQPGSGGSHGLAAADTGAITFVQRFGGLVNLNVHCHLLIPDGVFTETPAQAHRSQ